MGGSRIACPGKTCLLRQDRGRRIGISIIAGKNSFTPGLASYPHMRHEVVMRAATDTFRCNTSVAESVKHTAFVINSDLGKIQEVSL